MQHAQHEGKPRYVERRWQENLSTREKKEKSLAYLSYFSNRGINRSAEAAASEPSTLKHREHCGH